MNDVDANYDLGLGPICYIVNLGSSVQNSAVLVRGNGEQYFQCQCLFGVAIEGMIDMIERSLSALPFFLIKLNTNPQKTKAKMLYKNSKNLCFVVLCCVLTVLVLLFVAI